ncbi:MAG: hypothetical protein HY914_10160 [Desulfomonile tiedjei]|nr:hypothetical protein [Desulfomonile tiedjei]
MTIRDAFYSVEIPDETLIAMEETLGSVDVPGLQAWYRELDPENVRDLCASYQLWMDSQNESASSDLPTVPEVPVHTPDSTVPLPTNGRRLKIRFKTPRIAHHRS